MRMERTQEQVNETSNKLESSSELSLDNFRLLYCYNCLTHIFSNLYFTMSTITLSEANFWCLALNTQILDS